MKKTCTVCLEEKDISAFSRTLPFKGEPRWQSRCKRCRAVNSAARQAEKKAEISPHTYVFCDSCDKLQSKYVVGSTVGRRAEKKKCGSCGSEELIPY